MIVPCSWCPKPSTPFCVTQQTGVSGNCIWRLPSKLPALEAPKRLATALEGITEGSCAHRNTPPTTAQPARTLYRGRCLILTAAAAGPMRDSAQIPTPPADTLRSDEPHLTAGSQAVVRPSVKPEYLAFAHAGARPPNASARLLKQRPRRSRDAGWRNSVRCLPRLRPPQPCPYPGRAGPC